MHFTIFSSISICLQSDLSDQRNERRCATMGSCWFSTNKVAVIWLKANTNSNWMRLIRCPFVKWTWLGTIYQSWWTVINASFKTFRSNSSCSGTTTTANPNRCHQCTATVRDCQRTPPSGATFALVPPHRWARRRAYWATWAQTMSKSRQ